MSSIVSTAILVVFAAALAYVAYRAITAPFRALWIPAEAWRVSLKCWRTNRPSLAPAAIVIAAGLGLQVFFSLMFPGLDDWLALGLSLTWQALTAIALAVIAVPVHLRMIAQEPKDFDLVVPMRDLTHAGIMLRAACYAGLVWLIVYSLTIGLRFAIGTAPTENKVLLYRVAQILIFAVGCLFVLVRPALASRLKTPLRTGLKLAIKHAAPLILVEILLLLPSFAFNLAGTNTVLFLFGLSLPVRIINAVLFTVFSVFQLFAVEAASVILLRTAILVPSSSFSRASGNKTAYAFFRPY